MTSTSRAFLPVQVLVQEGQRLRYVYVKQHVSEEPQEAQPSSGSRLFVIGLPVCQQSLEEALQQGFSAVGVVETVLVHPSKVSRITVKARLQRTSWNPGLSPSMYAQISAVVCLKDSDAWSQIQRAASTGKVLNLCPKEQVQAVGLRSKPAAAGAFQSAVFAVSICSNDLDGMQAGWMSTKGHLWGMPSYGNRCASGPSAQSSFMNMHAWLMITAAKSGTWYLCFI